MHDQSQQSQFTKLIIQAAQEDSQFYAKLFINQNQAAIPIFRSLPSVTRNLMLLRIHLGQPSLDYYESMRPGATECFTPAIDLSLVIIKSNPTRQQQEIFISQNFADSINVCIEGDSVPCFNLTERQQIVTGEIEEEWKNMCQVRWKKLFNVISQQSDESKSVPAYGRRIMQTLKDSQMLVKNSDIGFQFILTSTRQQINLLIKHYAKQMMAIHKNTADVIRFILEIQVLDPKKCYMMQNLTQIQAEILEDFDQLGFISKQSDYTLRITYLLWNFLYDQPQVSIDIHCNIIVESNFRIYAYLESRDLLEADILLNLLSLFAEKKYRFPNLIIADLNQESLYKAFKRNLKAQQIIQFLEINNRNVSQHKQIEEDRKQRQRLKETQQQEVKKRLGFLRVFQDEAMSANPILPHNVVQQLKFWERELQGDISKLI